ncbi:MAG: TonB-dependent receptor, partial [Candidatus Eisenbacteria bacterium]|nr:TonB-dependent receptor [Candidatus Eisenbacteria bacterium]
FVPDLPTLDLNDIDRIEVLRGPAPITYGSTSFVGVIHVIHRRPGAGAGTVSVSGGSFGTIRGSASSDVGTRGRISVDGAHEGFADDDAGVDRIHGRYRLALPRGIHVDADVAVVNQQPTSPHPRVGQELDPNIPLDANHNPDDAKLDRTRFQISASQSHPLVDWTAAFSHVEDENVRGFLHEDAADDGRENASGYTQERDFNEFYAEAHRRIEPTPRFGLTGGADFLFGVGKEESHNFTYYAPLDGRNRTSSAEGTLVENTEFEAERAFLGVFAEADWRPSQDVTVLAGLRFNNVEEKREGEAEDEDGNEMPAEEKLSKARLGARAGVSWRAWEMAEDDATLYVDYRDTFKPAAIDFGPEAEVDPLKPETARSVSLGVRTNLLHRRLHLDASVFRMDFENLVISTSVDGRPALRNAGKERFDGFEVDAEVAVTREVHGTANYSYHDATFRDYAQIFGDDTEPT